jgi:predicted RNase H-like nuclease (RuvC/YqgF family)
MQSLPMKDDSLDKEQAPFTLEAVNEPLQQAIEQLRLANQALEATTDEIGALNDQLEMMHEEVESLSREVVRLSQVRELACAGRSSYSSTPAPRPRAQGWGARQHGNAEETTPTRRY